MSPSTLLTPLAPRGSAILVAVSLLSSSVLIVAPTPARAAGALDVLAPAGDTTTSEGAATERAATEAAETEGAATELPEEAAIRAALDDGDLTTARELAVARAEAEPSPANLRLEAEVWIALGDYEQAKAAYDAALEALGEDAADEREEIEGEREAIEARSRGTRADEPESEHRERFDEERAARLAALVPKPPPPPEVIDTPPREPIVKKWYFWVTLGAIVASAGAIVGLAAASAVDEGGANANASASRRPIPAGGVVFRF